MEQEKCIFSGSERPTPRQGLDEVHFPFVGSLGVLPEGYGKDMEMYRIRVGAQWIMYFFRVRANCLFWAPETGCEPATEMHPVTPTP